MKLLVVAACCAALALLTPPFGKPGLFGGLTGIPATTCPIGTVRTGVPVTILETTGGGAIAAEIREIKIISSFIF